MKSKLVVLLLVSILIFIPSSSVFAAEEDISITPYTSTYILQLNAGSYISIYTGDIPFLLPETVTVTNNINNLGNILVRVISNTGEILSNPESVAPGTNLSLKIQPDLNLFGDDTYTIQICAETISGVYAISIDKGDTGSNIIIVELNTETYTYLTELEYNATNTRRYTITNHSLSSGGITLKITGAENGVELNPNLPSRVLMPGQFTQIDVLAYFGANAILSAQASDTDGVYYITIVEVE